MRIIAVQVLLQLLAQECVIAFSVVQPGTPLLTSYRQSALQVHAPREADLIEQMVGGERYSLIPMPDCMKSTTAYVGNLCEFVRDDDLSDLFAQVSVLRTLPCCVVRKPDSTSLRYGFVSFPNVQEKDVC